jgi:hypothetical protein
LISPGAGLFGEQLEKPARAAIPASTLRQVRGRRPIFLAIPLMGWQDMQLSRPKMQLSHFRSLAKRLDDPYEPSGGNLSLPVCNSVHDMQVLIFCRDCDLVHIDEQRRRLNLLRPARISCCRFWIRTGYQVEAKRSRYALRLSR